VVFLWLPSWGGGLGGGFFWVAGPDDGRPGYTRPRPRSSRRRDAGLSLTPDQFLENSWRTRWRARSAGVGGEPRHRVVRGCVDCSSGRDQVYTLIPEVPAHPRRTSNLRWVSVSVAPLLKALRHDKINRAQVGVLARSPMCLSNIGGVPSHDRPSGGRRETRYRRARAPITVCRLRAPMILDAGIDRDATSANRGDRAGADSSVSALGRHSRATYLISEASVCVRDTRGKSSRVSA